MKASHPSSLSSTLPKPRLLIVDDQPINIRVLHELFKNDYETFMASDGKQAIEKCKSVLPDLVLLDVVMPEMDGYQVCKELKSDAQLAVIPVIFVTAHYDEADEAMGFELGAVDFIHKPINPLITRARVKNQILLKQQADLLRSMALVDGLTGVANRLQFESSLVADWLQCAREQHPLSIIMIDVDHFKKYNDYYGHQAGDECLRKVAQTIAASLRRPSDKVSRYGGEEFACVLPKTDLQGAIYLANEIENMVRSLNIEHQNSTTSEVVTISLGVATVIPTQDTTPNDLIGFADQQLYLAKNNGRARVSSIMVAANNPP